MKFDLASVKDREGDVAIVTGANSGVGFEVCVGLARKSMKVVMACRSPEKAETARRQILTHVPGSHLEILRLDLSDFESVGDFARAFREGHDRIDLLINNAGILDYSKRTNDAGVEMQFATNHLGHFLLTALLLDLFPESSASRIVSTSSNAHKKGKIFFDDINCDKATKWDVPYCQSKLACLIFADELHRRLQSSGKKILSVCAHPGATDSGLFQNMPKVFYRAMQIFVFPFILHSNASAARPTLLAALGDTVKGGQYFGPTGFLEMKGPPGIASRTEYSKDLRVAEKLWTLSEKMTGRGFDIEMREIAHGMRS